jgi:hypothetical protein
MKWEAKATSASLLGRYEGVNSAYLRAKVGELPPGQHGYVSDLVLLYRFIRGETGGFAMGYKARVLQQRYPEEYAMLLAEQRGELFEQDRLLGG